MGKIFPQAQFGIRLEGFFGIFRGIPFSLGGIGDIFLPTNFLRGKGKRGGEQKKGGGREKTGGEIWRNLGGKNNKHGEKRLKNEGAHF